jgi:hypothetical protein
MRVGLPHLGQSVLLVVSITFLRSAVLAILAIDSPEFLCDYILANSTRRGACSETESIPVSEQPVSGHAGDYKIRFLESIFSD